MKKLTLACALLASCSVFATDVFVRTSTDATSWNNIPGANILTLPTGNKLPNVGADSVLYLAPGTYTAVALTVGRGTETTPPTSAKSKIYGGFKGDESAIDLNARLTSDLDGNGIVEPWEFSNEAIITASGDSVKFLSTTGSKSRMIVVCGPEAEVNGVTITDFYYPTYAGPITLGVPTATGTVANSVTEKAGFLRLCTVKRMKAGYGIVTSTNKYSKIENCLIESNVMNVANFGGAVFLNAVGGTVSGCIIRNNASVGGGARSAAIHATSIAATDMDAIVENCVVYNNYAIAYGGAIRGEGISGKRGLQIVNSTIVNNKTNTTAQTGYASVELINCGLIANSIAVGDISREIRANTANSFIASNVMGDSIITAGGYKAGNMRGKEYTDLSFKSPTGFAGVMIPDYTTPFVQADYDAIRKANFTITSSSSPAVLVAGVATLPANYTYTGGTAAVSITATVPAKDITGASRAGNSTVGAYVYQQPTKLETASVSKAAAYATENAIVIRGNVGDIASVYNVTGKLINKVSLTSNQTTIAASKGLYIVVLGTHKNKVIVK